MHHAHAPPYLLFVIFHFRGHRSTLDYVLVTYGSVREGLEFYVHGLRDGLTFLHANNVSHCDIKVANTVVVVKPGELPRLQLIDLGLSGVHGAGTGAHRVCVFFESFLDFSFVELDHFAALQSTLMLYSSFKCRDNTELESPWDALNSLSGVKKRPLEVLGSLYRAKTAKEKGWLVWNRLVAIDPVTILGEDVAEELRMAQLPRKVRSRWERSRAVFDTNDVDEDRLLKWADGLFPLQTKLAVAFFANGLCSMHGSHEAK